MNRKLIIAGLAFVIIGVIFMALAIKNSEEPVMYYIRVIWGP